MATLRIATFNLENFDETKAGDEPSLDTRIELMRPQIVRLRADIACFQEVHGQERPGQPRALLALTKLLETTNLDGATLTSTKPADNDVFDVRNLVVATKLPVSDRQQLKKFSGGRAAVQAADRHPTRPGRGAGRDRAAHPVCQGRRGTVRSASDQRSLEEQDPDLYSWPEE
jgi:hypothetical protein